MCSGKSTVGKLLSERLGWEFIDLDQEIVNREGLTIPDIFEKKGEPYFRELELEVLRDVSSRDRVVVSTGGGLGANPKAMEIMKKKGLVVWLKVSYEDFINRCGNDRNRPLLRRGEEELKDLMNKRERIYSMADMWIEAGATPEDAVKSIESKLRGGG